MRERPDVVDGTDVRTEAEGERKRIDLSVPQVAGSALAAVIAAKLASSFGVYGTILGAGLVSVIATCGGTLFQHFFKRTGEQIRSTAVVTRERSGTHTRTQAVEPARNQAGGQAPPAPGEFTEGTVYRARVKSWKRPLVAAAVVFGVTMTGITVYELASGHSMSGGGSTTVGNAFSGGSGSSSDSGSTGDEEDTGDSGTSGTSGNAGNSEEPGSGGGAPTDAPSGTAGETGGTEPSGSASPDGGGTAPSPTPTPGATEGEVSGDATGPAPDASATAPEPSASSRSGTGDQGPGGPSAP
ncbi:hypothetical protein H0H10_03045 [Streptomyces sp. TRM S81-3]|uniref:Uncharacterized protein n=1 Tax=Streptomyces griseicoloratus TaxID=2752516 RepID=A0A926KYK3_9ACTN|nr:hypothetical protein [Streptomyces griseicoloratus]MBD0418154.1 hypothetical protein [Streptomyces griseicoloratus]